MMLLIGNRRVDCFLKGFALVNNSVGVPIKEVKDQ
jgi:hypothetical protein